MVHDPNSHKAYDLRIKKLQQQLADKEARIVELEKLLDSPAIGDLQALKFLTERDEARARLAEKMRSEMSPAAPNTPSPHGRNTGVTHTPASPASSTGAMLPVGSQVEERDGKASSGTSKDLVVACTCAIPCATCEDLFTGAAPDVYFKHQQCLLHGKKKTSTR